MKKIWPLDPQTFDAMLAPPGDRVIWTAAAIGRRVGRSGTWVRKTLARLPGNPVRRHGDGNMYCFETELLAFLRHEEAA